MLLTIPKNPRLLHSITKDSLISIISYHTLNGLKSKLNSLKIRSNDVLLCETLKNLFCNSKSSTGNCSQSKEKKNFCISEAGKWPTGNRTTYKFNPETESALNAHVQAELKAFYYYLSMANYFDRVDVTLPGCRNYFLKMHEEEHQHAMEFINYINIRGGTVTLCSIDVPPEQDWKCPLNAFQTALRLEYEVAEALEAIHGIAKQYNDLSACDFIVTRFIKEQMESINEIAKLISVLSGIGDCALSRYIFDQNLLKSCSQIKKYDQKDHGKCFNNYDKFGKIY